MEQITASIANTASVFGAFDLDAATAGVATGPYRFPLGAARRPALRLN